MSRGGGAVEAAVPGAEEVGVCAGGVGGEESYTHFTVVGVGS